MSTTANNYHLPIFTSNFHTRVNKFMEPSYIYNS